LHLSRRARYEPLESWEKPGGGGRRQETTSVGHLQAGRGQHTRGRASLEGAGSPLEPWVHRGVVEIAGRADVGGRVEGSEGHGHAAELVDGAGGLDAAGHGNRRRAAGAFAVRHVKIILHVKDSVDRN